VVEKDGELFDKEGHNLEVFPDLPLRERPCYRVLDDWTQIPAGEPSEFNPHPKPTLRKPGLWLFKVESNRNGETWGVEKWICGPIHIDAQTRDRADNNFGRLVRFKTSAGAWRTWALPMAGVAGDAAEVLKGLFSMGLITDGTRDGKQKLIECLASSMPSRLIRCVPQIGWAGDTFVLPDCNIGPAAGDTVLQSEYIHGLTEMHTTGGTFEDWRRGVAAVAADNPLLVLALYVSFAGPVLARTHGESGGIHFTGRSSTGKTTILKAACSVWGGKQYARTWLATANGLEGTAAMSNDCLLALDEVSQCEPHHVGAVIYMIGNEAGKQRADRSGAARTTTRHRCAVISTGERSIADAMLEGGKRAKAGQAVRLIDVEVSARYGVFEVLHGFASSKELAEAVKVAAEQHHGHAGRRFLESLTADDQDLAERLAEIRARPAFNPDGADGQATRVAARFALFALAGELATEYDITDWLPGTATRAAEAAFQAWHAPRGKGSAEGQQALRAILTFIEKHGTSRFQDAAPGREVTGPMVRDRAGWFRYVEVGEERARERQYLFSSTGLREALTGLDFNGSVRLLTEFGVLPTPDKEGKHSKVEKVEGVSKRVYPILQRAVEAALDGVGGLVEVREFDDFDD
jgi:putative DNA primase/helicase